MEVILLCYIMVKTADGHELTSQMSYLYITVVFRQQTHSSLTWHTGSCDGKTQHNSKSGVYTLHSSTKKAHNWHILGVDCSQPSEFLVAQCTLNELMLGTKGLRTAQLSAMPVLETMY
jgi:hypothetical protein